MIPDYQTLMLPVLTIAAHGEVSTREAIERLAEEFDLAAEEREQILPSGRQRTFDNRVNWAKTYLKKAGLIEYPRRGYFAATSSGRKVLQGNPGRIDNDFLAQFQGFQDFHRPKKDSAPEDLDQSQSYDISTPDETLRAAYQEIQNALSRELLDRVRSASPQFFEELIIELLLAMGYGGTSEDAARALGQSGDNGIDGVVDQDPLGVDQIYVQAKRYSEGNNVGSGEMRDFYGALSLRKAQKGLFFTTSRFSASAKQTARDLGIRIVLIDGDQLTKLMIRYNVGCRDEDILRLKRVDEDYFSSTD